VQVPHPWHAGEEVSRVLLSLVTIKCALSCQTSHLLVLAARAMHVKHAKYGWLVYSIGFITEVIAIPASFILWATVYCSLAEAAAA